MRHDFLVLLIGALVGNLKASLGNTPRAYKQEQSMLYPNAGSPDLIECCKLLTLLLQSPGCAVEFKFGRLKV